MVPQGENAKISTLIILSGWEKTDLCTVLELTLNVQDNKPFIPFGVHVSSNIFFLNERQSAGAVHSWQGNAGRME